MASRHRSKASLCLLSVAWNGVHLAPGESTLSTPWPEWFISGAFWTISAHNKYVSLASGALCVSLPLSLASGALCVSLCSVLLVVPSVSSLSVMVLGDSHLGETGPQPLETVRLKEVT